MLAETFQKPKPILGVLQLLPLPGSSGWEGRLEPLMDRAEQEAMALASGGVDGILLENFYDAPYQADRMDPAGAIALAQVARRVSDFTNLPIGISVLQNDPETALAIALNVGASFIRVPVLIGGLLTEGGLVNSKLQALLAYQYRLKLGKGPKILTDLTQDHWLPSVTSYKPVSELAGSKFEQMAHLILAQGVADGLIVPANLLSREEFEVLQASVHVPILVEDPSIPQVAEYYTATQGLLLAHSIKKQPIAGLERRTTVDMVKVEEMINQVQPDRSWTHTMPKNSADLAYYAQEGMNPFQNKR